MSIESNLKSIAESHKTIATSLAAIAVYLVSDEKEKSEQERDRLSR